MNSTRRSLIAMAGMAPLCSLAATDASPKASGQPGASGRLVLSHFEDDKPYVLPGTGWRGFTDRVMGGVSDANFDRDEIDGQSCMRMSGDVTRDSGGGFVQMAYYFGESQDASAYRGLELLVYGNDEDYNVHIRTADCGWHDQSYRATFRATREWQTIRLPWSAFEANGVRAPLDTTSLQRVGLLGWMREFKADLALGEIALFA